MRRPGPDHGRTVRGEPIFNTEGRAFTLGFSLLCVAVYLAQQTMDYGAFASMVDTFGFTPRRLFGGIDAAYRGWIVPPWITLFSHMVIHANFWHLAFNLLAFLSFGAPLERAIGTPRMALLFIVGGVAAALTEGALTTNGWMPMIGASGAIFAVIGAYVMLWPSGRLLIFFLVLPGWAWLIVVVLLNIAFGYVWRIEGIAWWAHMGGMVSGVALIFVLRPRGLRLFQRLPTAPRRRRPRPPGPRFHDGP